MSWSATLSRSAPACAAMCLAFSFHANAATRDPATQNEFDSEFASFAAEPAPHEHPADAVDITLLEPSLEPVAGTVIENLGRGHASYYGRRFAGRPTAGGETFNPGALTAAHPTLPFGSLVRVTNAHNGLSVVVRINDRGPFVEGRAIDLSRAAAEQIGLVQRGVGEVELELLAS